MEYTTQLRTLNDVQFGSLDSSKNRNVLKYDHQLQKFILISMDEILSGISTTVIPQQFVAVVQNELDITNVKNTGGINGGTF